MGRRRLASEARDARRGGGNRIFHALGADVAGSAAQEPPSKGRHCQKSPKMIMCPWGTSSSGGRGFTVTYGEAASDFETFTVDAMGAADIWENSEPVVFASAIEAEPPRSGDREGKSSCPTPCAAYVWQLR